MKTLIPCLVSVVALLSAVPARSADTERTPQEVEQLAKELVRKLGNPIFQERQAASRELEQLGIGALKVIEEGLENPVPEIAYRCESLIPKIRSRDLKRRVEKFLADKDGEFEHDLPLLKVFREKLGAGDKSRALYVDIMKSLPNAELFDAVARGDAEGGRAIADRRSLMWAENKRFLVWNDPTRRQPPLADIAALQFAEWLVPADSIPKSGPWDLIIGQLMGEQPACDTIVSPDKLHHEAYRTIAANWLGSRTDPTQMASIVQALNMPSFATFKESRTLLRRMVLTEGLEPLARFRALTKLMQADWKSEPKLLRVVQKGEVRVGDFPDVYPNEKDPNRKITIRTDIVIFAGDNQLRDDALGYLVQQENLDIRDFGFETPEGIPPVKNKPVYSNQFEFRTEEKRAFGHAKWEKKESMDPRTKTDKPKKDEPK